MNASAEKSLASWVCAWTMLLPLGSLLPLGGVLLPTTVLGQGAPSAGKLSMPAEAIEAPITTSPGLTVPREGTAVGDVSPYTMQNAISASEGGSYSGGGVGYSPALGSHLRARYNSESYGQLDGNFDLGTMKMWQPDRDSAWFVDGQVTLNDESKVGYNVGVGYRWMTLPVFPWSPDREKIAGLSIWSDGSSAGGENFFPQVGISAELLGDTWDFRANAYIPVGPTSQDRDFRPTGNTVFFSNFLGAELIGIRDTVLTGGEVEVARRIRDLDAWVFGGAYAFDGGGFDTAGGRYGVRGYVTPDILAQFQMTHDDLFDTNAVVGLTWFIGRTRNNTALTCTLRDRFREPVLRNDYVAMVQSTATGAGAAVNNAAGTAQRFVHVDSTAAAGGDGSFEKPLNTLGGIQANSQTGDIILAHSGSNLTGSVATLKDNQRFFGEGGGRTASFTGANNITITAPATAPGAINGAVPILNGVAGQSTITLADNNRVENLSFIGGLNAIKNGTTGSANPNLNHLTIGNTTGDGISLAAVDRVDTTDSDSDSNTTETKNIMGTVTIDQVTFNNVAGNDIDINAATTATDNTGEILAISNVTSNGNTTDASIDIRNTHNTPGDTTTINMFTYNGGTAGQGAVRLTNTGSNTTIQNSTLTGGIGPSVDIQSAFGNVNVAGTTTITGVIGQGVRVENNTATGAVTIDADVTATARTVPLPNDAGIFVNGNLGTVGGAGDVTVTGNGIDAIKVNNAQAAVNFSGAISKTGTGTAVNVIDTTDGITDTGNVTINGTVTNSGGRLAMIDNGDDDVVFNGIINDTGSGILVQNRRSNGITSFNARTNLTTGANDAVTLTTNDNASTVNFSDVRITTTGAGRGLVSSGSSIINVTGSTSTITTATGRAIEIDGGSSTGGVNFSTVNTTTGPVTDAVSVKNFDGSVNINGGTLRTTGNGVGDQGVLVENASVNLNGVAINSASTRAVISTYTGITATARNVTLTNTNLNGDDVIVNSSASGTTTLNMSGVTNVDDISVTDTGAGGAIATLTNVTSTGDIAFSESGNGAGSLTVSGGSYAGGGAVFSEAGDGDGTFNVSGGTFAGSLTGASSGTGAFNTNLTGPTTISGGRIVLDATNSGVVSMAVRNQTYTGNGAGANAALDISIGNLVTTGNVTVENNTITSADALAFELDMNGGDVNYFVRGNTFNNNSATLQTALLDVSGATTRADLTISNNIFQNAVNSSDFQFELITSVGAPTANVDISGNTALENNVQGTIRIDKQAGTINLTDRANTFSNATNRNNAIMSFNPNDVTMFGDAVLTP